MKINFTLPSLFHVKDFLEENLQIHPHMEELYNAICEADVQLMYCEDLIKKLNIKINIMEAV